MKHATTVAWRDLRSLFVSPVAYVVMSLFAVTAGLFFIIGVSNFGKALIYYQQRQDFASLELINLADVLLAPFFDSMLVVFLFLVPGITMGLFASEKANGTEELLMTSPLTIWDIVLGKFAAGAGFVGLLVAMLGLFPALLFFFGDPEVGKILTGLLGVLLMGWTYVSIGVFASSITRSQIIAFFLAFVLLLMLLILPAITQLGVLGSDSAIASVLAWFSTTAHMQPMLGGLVDTADLVYFGVMIGIFLLLTKASVESVRWR
ncbi:MAG: ABC transporter permease subunit [Myxococcota bacterium]